MRTRNSGTNPHVSSETESLLRLGKLAERSRPSRERYFCVAGLGIPASGTLLDHGIVSLLPAAVAVAALLAAFVVMARRWGLKPSTAPTGEEVLARLEVSWDVIALDVAASPSQGPAEGRPDLALRE